MENYIQFTISLYDEGLMALLSLLPFESFEDVEGQMITYIKENELTAEVLAEVKEYLGMFGANYTSEVIPPRNWNEVWESNFTPVEVDDFVRIRADFHERSNDFDYELTIHPKMAFGTGHHETTHMMIAQMRHMDFYQKSVFDYGCGTGILAILANLLGANDVDAVDIELPSYESTIENTVVNGAPNVKAFHGDITAVPNRTYDIILANINRNILLESVDALASKCKKDTLLMLSGILATDLDVILDAYEFAGFEELNTVQKGNWLCVKLIYTKQ